MVDTLNTKPPGTFDKATPPKAIAKPIRFDLMKTTSNAYSLEDSSVDAVSDML